MIQARAGRCGPIWAAIFFVLLSSNVYAQGAASGPLDPAQMLNEADRFLASGDQDPRLHFIRGMALAELGRCREAADEFIGLLVRDPKQLRPRLELARVLMCLKQYQAARHHFEQVLVNDLPDTVRRNVNSALAAIRERTASWNVSLSLIADTNPSQSTSSQEVEIRGLRYRINNDSRPHNSSGYQVAFNGRMPLDDSLWFARTNGETQSFSDQRYNFQYLQAAIGRHFHFDRRTVTIESGAHGSAYSNNSLYDGATIGVSDYRQIGNTSGLQLSLNALQFHYPTYRYLSGWQYEFATKAFYTPSSTSRWEVSASVLDNQARETAYAFTQNGLATRFQAEWNHGWVTSLGLYATKARYGAPDVLFGQRRHDDDQRVEIEIGNRKWRLWEFTPRLQMGRSQHHANIDFYSYERTYVRLGVNADM